MLFEDDEEEEDDEELLEEDGFLRLEVEEEVDVGFFVRFCDVLCLELFCKASFTGIQDAINKTIAAKNKNVFSCLFIVKGYCLRIIPQGQDILSNCLPNEEFLFSDLT